MDNSALRRPVVPSAIFPKLSTAGLGLWVIFFLSACASSNWQTVHPHFRVPGPQDEIGLVQLGDAFILTQPNWFAGQLAISPDSVHDQLARWTDSLLLYGMSAFYSSTPGPRIASIPSEIRSSLARETQKLDEKIYLKVQYPHQGQTLAAQGANPVFLLLIHEYTLGTDLQREAFYDYRLANQETRPDKTIDNLSILVSYTLWDNLKQVPLYSGVASVQTPLQSEKLSRSEFMATVLNSARQCIRQIQEAP